MPAHPQASDYNSLLVASPIHTTNSATGLSDPEAQPTLCYPDQEEIEKDQLHRVLSVNALTQGPRVRKEPLLAPEAQDTVTLPYSKQLALPLTEVTHESNCAKKMFQLLKFVHVSAYLEKLKGISPILSTALESFLIKYKDMNVYRVVSLSTENGDQKDCTYIDMVVHKVKVRAIIDSGAPGNIVSSKLMKKLKLAPDLDYQEVFGTADLLTTKAMGACSSLPLWFGKLIATAPAIVLENSSYDLLIGTGFMTKYRTIKNHGDDNFKNLGQIIPIYYTGNKVVDLPKKKLHFINIKYADRDIPIAYTLQHRKLKLFPISTKGYNDIPLFASSAFFIPSGSQVLHHTRLSLELPPGLHGEVFSHTGASQPEPWICPGVVMSGPEDLQVLLANLSPSPLLVQKNQHIDYVKLEEHSKLVRVSPFAVLDELGLLEEKPMALTMIPRDSLLGLKETEKDQTITLFEKYKEVFAKDDFYLGKAARVEHVIDTQGHTPIKSRSIRRSQVNQAIVNEELKNY
ncbi:Ankyrin repeat and SOCS box protein 3 [Entomophthora muscae]|uniref:Ankyrin repeat and SOCS box protein 3 n=1 Tax=Entomophthora muscae TaxID=34485 RepID=A0ACC2TT84_9FUNG|nr:Ankyrin repeat and SOCS box protein 3 [Entomophthora muscae]